jgi:hypothetical protein
MSYLDYFDPHVKDIIVGALRTAYDRNVLAFDPEIGNTPVSFGVSTWQSTLHYLELGFGSMVGADVHRVGSAFHIKLPGCRVSAYKFGSTKKAKAKDFRLDGSRKRKLIIENNQMSLFNYTMNSDAQPVAVPEIVVVHSGNFEEGLLEVFIGAPISADRAEDGWLWLDKVYDKDDGDFGGSGARIDTPPPISPTPTFKDLPQPNLTVEEMPEERPARRRENNA